MHMQLVQRSVHLCSLFPHSQDRHLLGADGAMGTCLLKHAAILNEDAAEIIWLELGPCPPARTGK